MLDMVLLQERIKSKRFKSMELVSPADNVRTNIRKIQFNTMLDSTFMQVYGYTKLDKPAKRYNFCLSSVQQVEEFEDGIRFIAFPFFVGDKGKSLVLTLNFEPLH